MPVTTVLVMVLLKLMEALVQFISLGHGAGGVGKWGRGGGNGDGKGEVEEMIFGWSSVAVLCDYGLTQISALPFFT